MGGSRKVSQKMTTQKAPCSSDASPDGQRNPAPGSAPRRALRRLPPPATSAGAFSSTFHQDWVSGRLWAEVRFNKQTSSLAGRFLLWRVEAQTQREVFLSTGI